jgi:hypothetical protein
MWKVAVNDCEQVISNARSEWWGARKRRHGSFTNLSSPASLLRAQS